MGFVLNVMGNPENAVTLAEQGLDLGPNMVGLHYAHLTLLDAHNQLGQLPLALKAAQDAAEHFAQAGAVNELAFVVKLRAKILRKVADDQSRHWDTLDAAKSLVRGAIEDIVGFWILTRENKTEEKEKELQEEVNALLLVSARCGMRPEEIDKIVREKLHGIAASEGVVSSTPSVALGFANRFPAHEWYGMVASQQCDMANDALKRDREEANRWFGLAMASAPEETAQDRALKALIAYRYGENLGLQFGLLGTGQGQAATVPEEKRAKAREFIQRCWSETIRLCGTITEKDMAEFGGDEPKRDLRRALEALRQAPVMGG